MPVTLQIGSPFTWAGSVIGEERMMLWMLKKPRLVHRVLETVSDFVVAVAQHYAEEFGAENLMAFHGAATESNKLISPRQFETFVLPYYQRVNERVIDLGVSSMFIHICGEQNKNLEYWQQVPVPEHTIISVGREVTWRPPWRGSRGRSSPGTSTRRSSRRAALRKCWSRHGSASRQPRATPAATCSWQDATFLRSRHP